MANNDRCERCDRPESEHLMLKMRDECSHEKDRGMRHCIRCLDAMLNERCPGPAVNWRARALAAERELYVPARERAR